MDDIEMEAQDGAPVQAAVAAKFCSMGLVSSHKWFSSFVIIHEGVLRLYDEEKTYLESPRNFVLEINLTKNHTTSPIRRKNYANDTSTMVEFFCFYVEIENGVFFPSRQLKIGCMKRHVAEKLVLKIKEYTKGYWLPYSSTYYSNCDYDYYYFCI